MSRKTTPHLAWGWAIGGTLLATLAMAAPQRSAPVSAAPGMAVERAPAASLQSLLDAELARFPARAGVWVKHLATGEEAGVRADETFNSASVIKLPVLALAFEMVEAGQLSLGERITVRTEDFRGGSGILRHFDAGIQPTFRDVLHQMIQTSDNTATDIAIARVGGVERANAWIRENGFGDGMRLTQTTADLFEKYGSLPQGADRSEKTNFDRTFWLGEMTPRSTGLLLEGIERRTLVSQAAGDEMIRMMRTQLAGSRRLPHYLTVPVAHKTGDFAPALANDVGIVYARSGPIVISFFTNEIEEPYGEAEDRIGRIAQAIVDYFDGAP
jgi:beta-lactamase class A